MATLTRTEVERSEWAQAFFVEVLGQYAQAMNYACDPDMAYRIIEQDDADYPKYALVPVVGDGFWMAVSDDTDTLADLCAEMGWRYEYG